MTEDDPASVEERVRRIRSEMPHLSTEEIVQFCRTLYEIRRADAAELLAAANASRTMSEVIKGAGAADLKTALPILVNRAAHGDEQAADLLERFEQAVPNLGLGDHL
jgi:hypothetical protein